MTEQKIIDLNIELLQVIQRLPKIVLWSLIQKTDKQELVKLLDLDNNEDVSILQKMFFDLVKYEDDKYMSLDDFEHELYELKKWEIKTKKVQQLENFETDNNLIKNVISITLDKIIDEPTDETLERFVYEIENYGSQTGISGLIYHDENKKFFVDNLQEILELMNDEPKKFEYNLISNIVWYSFDTTLSNLYHQLD
jgi:hypothetical protein